MAYCSRCGVEVTEHQSNCPLCNAEIHYLEEKPIQTGKFPRDLPTDKKSDFTDSQRIFLAFIVVSTVFITCSLVILAIDYLQTQTMSWSRYPLISIALIWTYVALPLMFPKSGTILAAGYTGISALYLYLLDSFNPAVDWFFNLGLPILATALGIVGIIIFMSIRALRGGLNITGYILIGIALLTGSVNFLTNRFLGIHPYFSWSIIVGATLLPIALFLFYLHYGLKKDINIRKTFHF